jgi:hypothetical protein
MHLPAEASRAAYKAKEATRQRDWKLSLPGAADELLNHMGRTKVAVDYVDNLNKSSSLELHLLRYSGSSPISLLNFTTCNPAFRALVDCPVS